MITLRHALTFFLVATLASCSSLQTSNIALLDHVVVIRAHDLIAQTKSGNGEGLAKPVPGQPLLINNQLVFAGMGDAVLGIAMAVGTIKQTVELFEGMQALLMEEWLRTELEKETNNPGWQQLLGRLESQGKTLILEPYVMRNGHPSAVLEVRVRVRIMQDTNIIWTNEIVEKSERFPLRGEGSWSELNQQRIYESSKRAIPLAVYQIFIKLTDMSVTLNKNTHRNYGLPFTKALLSKALSS